jgi:hypothetical protein
VARQPSNAMISNDIFRRTNVALRAHFPLLRAVRFRVCPPVRVYVRTAPRVLLSVCRSVFCRRPCCVHRRVLLCARVCVFVWFAARSF